MDNEIREINEKLGELQSMMEDNQRMVRSLYSKAKWATVLSVFKWILIIGVTVGSFYYIQPFIEKFMVAFDSISGNSTTGLSSIFKNLDFVKKAVK
jgi:monomeric isocitrate dehydrogenase